MFIEISILFEKKINKLQLSVTGSNSGTSSVQKVLGHGGRYNLYIIACSSPIRGLLSAGSDQSLCNSGRQLPGVIVPCSPPPTPLIAFPLPPRIKFQLSQAFCPSALRQGLLAKTYHFSPKVANIFHVS